MQTSKTEIAKRIKLFAERLREKGIDAYLVPTDDFHGSEYVGSYFKCRKFLSGFTGSAGTLVVFQDGSAGLFTDGRYFIQAEDELKDTGITLYKMGEPGVKTLKELLGDSLPNDAVIGFDGRVMSIRAVNQIEAYFESIQKKVHFSYKEDLVDTFWQERPALAKGPVFVLDQAYSGKGSEEKLAELRAEMKERGADYLLIASLDDIAWLLNIRSSDVAYNPVMLGYLLIGLEGGVLYSSLASREQSEKAKEAVGACLEMKPYNQIYEDLSEIVDQTLWLDQSCVNYALLQAAKAKNIIFAKNPTALKKAVKNKTEIANLKLAHQKDGLAVTRYLYWLKHLPADSKGRLHDGGELVTEIFAAEKLDSFRKKATHYLGQSFDPIVAAGAHAAIVHYSATRETDAPISIGTFVLHDTGGQYLEGTTDITRTVCLGEVTEEMKRHFTLVLKGHLRLMSTVFLKGVRGENLDIIAREPLWKEALNYNHGTGHGVGYLLNVHEGPNHIRFRISDQFDPSESAEILPGMVTSNEPGLYLQNQYGIRHENLVLCVEKQKNEYGQFLGFETLTLVPFDLEAIDVSLLSEEEKEILNAYHKLVYETLSPELDDAEREWLLEETREI